MLYYSFFYCHLQYCIMSWGTANNSVLQVATYEYFA